MGRITKEKVGGYDDNEVEKSVLQVFFDGNGNGNGNGNSKGKSGWVQS